MESVRGLASLLTFLATHPSPDRTVEAFLHGPLIRFNTGYGSVHLVDEARCLVLVGVYGMSTVETDRYRVISLGVDIPITRAFLDVEVLQVQQDEIHSRFPSLFELDGDILKDLKPRGHLGTLFQVPIIRGGYPIGVYSFMCRERVVASPADVQYLEAIGAALALWVSDPASKVALPSRTRWDTADEAWSLTQRQRQILFLAAKDKSGPAIAEALGYSLSTIKQEMHRITRSLRVESRKEAVAKAERLGLLDDIGDRSRRLRSVPTTSSETAPDPVADDDFAIF